MKVKFGAIVVDGRNKLGGHVFSKNRGGAYVRTKVTPVNPQTTFQSTARNRLTNFSQNWKALTDSQREGWISQVTNYATTDIFGDIKNPSGVNLYVKLNTNLDQVGEAAIDDAPAAEAVEAVIDLSAVADESGGTLNITWTPTPVPANTAYIVDATEQVSPGVAFVENLYRQLTFFPTTTVSPQDVGTDYIARFGAFIVGQKIGIRLTPVNTNTGQKGNSLTTLITVQA